ncbi:MAG: glycosyltransferase family 2 protein [Elusimicrobiales bacterium]|nr:glycosyltransferase family 2 protein [Elusimicrobiales bacterium]
MKLVVQIPCYNEEEFLPSALNDLPERIEGVDEIAVIVIDDGSADRTAEVAKAHPRVAKVVRLPYHQGLAAAFRAGVDAALSLKADIIVNTDADNQYPGRFIPSLIRPILDNRADFVVGARQMDEIKHFSYWKKVFQKAGSAVISFICGSEIPDATSGFRAFSRGAALWIDVIASNYTYTLETLVRLSSHRVRMAHVPITVNPPARSSRLMGTTLEYVLRSTRDILTLIYIYSPLRVFIWLAVLFGIPGLVLTGRFLYYYVTLTVLRDLPTGFEQSLTVGVGLLIISFFTLLMGITSNLIHTNRKLLERLVILHSKDGE